MFTVILRGYATGPVDELIGRIEQGEVTAEQVRSATFTTVLRGYDPRQVHAYLEEKARRLER